MFKKFSLVFLSILISLQLIAQGNNKLWHQKERARHYRPTGNDFVLDQGRKKFNRALYGANTAFRVEAGDLPEFALYLPGMGGNCRIALSIGGKTKWLTEATGIKTTYRPGNMVYQIKDELIKTGTLVLTVCATYEQEGMIVKMKGTNIPAHTEIFVVYGGVSGKKFSRDGDIGADPESSFYLTPEYCRGNQFKISKNQFELFYGANNNLVSGLFPSDAVLKVADAHKTLNSSDLAHAPKNDESPVLLASFGFQGNSERYFFLQKEKTVANYGQLKNIYLNTENSIREITKHLVLETPDEYINPLGGALAMAADAIWESPTYLHGAVAWRMRLPAWRGAFVADPLGWHDRAREHFDSYLKSQVTNIPPGLAEPDTTLHFARQKERMGNAMFSNGYICRNPNGDIRPHHYDMNLGFIDQLLTHLNYTGDWAYAKKVWPAIKRHLQWEKRNFDADDDGLYDAYACIWSSDALQYSGGGVTHSTAYNYRANRFAAKIAAKIGEDGTPYTKEADKILSAMNLKLWLKDKGWFAEYKDRSGLQRTHDAPGLWTVYHAIDGGTASSRQQYQLLRYIDNNIPHIPINATGLPFKDLYLLSTTNWQPYTWSVNNVALAENLHTALAYWQASENDNAFRLWKSALTESMYLGSTPGNFQQLSFYDAIRGELYRDFADPVGMAARSLTEGLFGILPDALHNQLLIKPGFPSDWKFAKIKVPDISLNYQQNGPKSIFNINQRYEKLLNMALVVPVGRQVVKKVVVNGRKAPFNWVADAWGRPLIKIEVGFVKDAVITIETEGQQFGQPVMPDFFIENTDAEISFPKTKVIEVEDPQNGCKNIEVEQSQIKITPRGEPKNYSLFVKLKQGETTWIQPLHIRVKPQVDYLPLEKETSGSVLAFALQNNTDSPRNGIVFLNGFEKQVRVNPHEKAIVNIAPPYVTKGSNRVQVRWEDGFVGDYSIINWDLPSPKDKTYEPVSLSEFYNENISNIFLQKYLTPRPDAATLQIPWQGIGNWCYPLILPEITEKGLKNRDTAFLEHIPFLLNGNGKNILFTSLWNNFPDSVTIPLTGKAVKAYLLMAGTTNHQQSQIENGIVEVRYTDGSKDQLPVRNPENWWPIEQDLIEDGYAFTTGAARPYRFVLKTGEFTRKFTDYSTIKGFTDKAIEGGAGTLLDMPLNRTKELKSVTIKTTANEVVIGVMSLTLVRDPF